MKLSFKTVKLIIINPVTNTYVTLNLRMHTFLFVSVYNNYIDSMV